MAGIQDFQEFCDDFNGTVATLPASADPATPWLVDDTSSSGTPTYTTGTSEAVLTLASTTEVENVCLHFGDSLDFDIDLLQRVEMRVKTVATLDSATSVAFGMASARNDAIDSIAAHASFRLIGSNQLSSLSRMTAVTDKDDIATGVSLVATYKRFVIDFTGGKSDVKFYIDGARVAASTTFDMSGYSAGLQPYVQIQKTSDANTDSVTVDYVYIVSKRA
jgi:hypothetical protein